MGKKVKRETTNQFLIIIIVNMVMRFTKSIMMDI